MSAVDRLVELRSVELRGFKSVDAEGQTMDIGPITVMLGANGAGKSNLVSFFRMLNHSSSLWELGQISDLQRVSGKHSHGV